MVIITTSTDTKKEIQVYIGLDKKKIERKIVNIFLYPLVLSCVLGAIKNRLIETFLLSTHNICSG